MLLEAARIHSIDLGSSWMIGDSEIDMKAGVNAGCKTARVLSKPEFSDHVDITASSLLDSVRQILEWDARPRIEVAKRKVIA
jgi:D-glycero-D-manno-heptose 1,7-bisphosphate phosphatase